VEGALLGYAGEILGVSRNTALSRGSREPGRSTVRNYQNSTKIGLLGGGKQDYVALVVAASHGHGFAVAGVVEGPDLTGSEMSELATGGVAENGQGPDVWCAVSNVRQSHRAVLGHPRDGARSVIKSVRYGWLCLERTIVRGDHGEEDLAVFAGTGESDMAAIHGRKWGTEGREIRKADGWTSGKGQFEDKAGAVALFQVENPVPCRAHRKTLTRAVG
jgi:hypothetical protein